MIPSTFIRSGSAVLMAGLAFASVASAQPFKLASPDLKAAVNRAARS